MIAAAPWRVVITNDRRADVYSAGNPYVLATVYESGNDGNARENARMIAAAPAMLAALRSLVERADRRETADGSSLDTLEAHAALQLATGEPWLTDPE